jgi:hypothetical protein
MSNTNDFSTITTTLLLMQNELTRMRTSTQESDEAVHQRIDRIEAIVKTGIESLQQRLDMIEARVDRTRSSEPQSREDPLFGTIPSDKGKDYIQPFTKLVKEKWPISATGIERTTDEDAKMILEYTMKAVDEEVLKVRPTWFKQGATRNNWSSLSAARQDEMIANVEQYAAENFSIYLCHCKSHWLTRRLFSRGMADR